MKSMERNTVKQILIIAGIALIVTLWVAPMVKKMLNKSSDSGESNFEDGTFEFEGEN
jgi:hypothetical protein